MNQSFTKDICQYIEDNIPGFTFGAGNSNLKIGELSRDTQGVYVIQSPSIPPEAYSPIEYASIDFWSRYSSSDEGYNKLEEIKQKLHRMYHYQTANFYIYYSGVSGNIEDQDKDSEGCKLYKIGIDFIYRNLNIIS